MNELVSPAIGRERLADRELHAGLRQYFETEALPGALPVGRNSPQKANYGLYAEQLSGRRSRRRRRRTSAPGSIASARACGTPAASSASTPGCPHRAARERLPIGQLRWGPTPIPGEKLTFVAGLRTMTTAGDCDTQAGMAAQSCSSPSR